MKYAVIKNGGHQYKVEEGQIIEVEKLDSDGKSYVFEEVLLSVDGDKVELGTPTVTGLKVYADVVSEVKGDKIEVFKYKSKSRYRKHTGHRQKYTQLKITGIGLPRPQAGTKKTTVSPRSSKSEAGKKVVAKKSATKKVAK
jgi:large subunit ribosomal protein L21